MADKMVSQLPVVPDPVEADRLVLLDVSDSSSTAESGPAGTVKTLSLGGLRELVTAGLISGADVLAGLAGKLSLTGGAMAGNIVLPGGSPVVGTAAQITAWDQFGRLAINNVEIGTVRRNVVGDLLNEWTSLAYRDPVLTRSANRVQYTGYFNVPASMNSWACLIPYGYRPYLDNTFAGRYLGGSLVSPSLGAYGIWYLDDNAGLILKPNARIDGLIVHISWITPDPWPPIYPGTPV